MGGGGVIQAQGNTPGGGIEHTTCVSFAYNVDTTESLKVIKANTVLCSRKLPTMLLSMVRVCNIDVSHLQTCAVQN